MTKHATIFLLGILFLSTYIHSSPKKTPSTISPKVSSLLDNYCFSCHDEDTTKGDIRLDNLSHLSLNARLEMLNKIQEQIFTVEMPPKKKKKQPSESERQIMLHWVSQELQKHNASKLEDKLRYYKYGNYINHEKLFSGKIVEKPFTPTRRWLVNDMIYNERVNEIFRLKGKKRQSKFYGVSKAFNLPSQSGVKYYDNNTVEGGQFLTLVANAKWIVDKQLRSALLKNGEFKYPEEYLTLPTKNIIYRFPDELWNLGRTEKEFEQILLNKNFPSDSDIKGAIICQFEGALQRLPNDNEMSRYLQFAKSSIKIGGNSTGLRKMMVAVIMEPDFIYRNELGDNKPDKYNRIKMTPREASYAIAYALTDKIPAGTLLKASKTLTSKKDFEREVLSILNNDNIEKPRLLRFFQDYFGYKNIYKVFKDEERFAGAYNPHRVVAARYIWRIPGKISKEADTLVKYILKNDKDVLKELLTTDKFFVHHNGDNKAMKKAAKDAMKNDIKNRDTYKRLMAADFRKNATKAAKATGLYLKGNGKIAHITMGNEMNLFELKFGKNGKSLNNKKPMPRDPEAIDHSVKMYNLNYLTWEYEPVQPLKIENRSGLLTHPAWLVSHSQNSHTDPITRGKWVREKLLGGFIQDVPITVDANIPEDHHKTLRERFSVTEDKKCWGCHEKMNPLGLVFESYDDFGRYRTEEMLEHPDNIVKTITETTKGKHGIVRDFKIPIYKSKKVNSKGYLSGTGEKGLDGEVSNAKDLMNRLAKSVRVRQSFIRHVFRYFMGRNEMLSDSQTLIKADKAYVANGGSFKALVVSLLTSDSFMYRKELKE